MRSTFATIAAIATLATSALAATDCNPSYNVAPSTACYTACNVVSTFFFSNYSIQLLLLFTNFLFLIEKWSKVGFWLDYGPQV